MPAAEAAQWPCREFPYTEGDFRRAAELIFRRAGISLSSAKQDLVYSRLVRRLRECRLGSFSEYLDLVESGDAAELQAFTNALTTNLTAFFREEHHFEILVKHLQSLARDVPISIWCAASSTGEEAYSIAMAAVECFGGFKVPLRIVASDIDTQVLERAQAGVYTADRIERLSTERVRRFFLRGTGSQQGMVRVRDELRALVRFEQLNLLSPDWAVKGPFDAIFCRNVLIYFDKATQATVLRRMAPLMHPHGLLFIGHSESLFHVAEVFTLQGRTVYNLTGTRATSAASSRRSALAVAPFGALRG